MLTPDQSSPPSSAPLVSMLVICYNQARFVVETLESAKAQTYKNTELIIADDCSTDDSVAVIERWLSEKKIQCTFIRHEKNQGVCKTLNEALSHASGKYISMIASDDLWLPDKIESQVAIMESQPESVGVLYSDTFLMDENGRDLPKTFHERWNLPENSQGQVLDALLKNNFIPGLTSFIRRDCYRTVGRYDEDLPWEDWDMWLRIARHYTFAYSAQPSAKYRIHPSSVSRRTRTMLTGTILLLSKQVGLGLNEEQQAIVRCSLAAYTESFETLNLQEANLTRLHGDRAATRAHLIAFIRSGGLRHLRRHFLSSVSLSMYVLFGIRRLRWWKDFDFERSIPPADSLGATKSRGRE